jgi:sensor histidine kinase YesM
LHPFLNSYKSILVIGFLWLLLTGAIALFTAQFFTASDVTYTAVILPWYLLLLCFCLSNFYICNWLPLSTTHQLQLVAVQLISLIISISVWVFLGSWWFDTALQLGLLDARQLFNESRLTHSLIGAALYLVWVLLHYAYLQAMESELINNRALAQQLLISQVELQSLKASIHPHFMYNSLNMLANMALVAPERVHEICVQMSDFLRYSVNYGKKEQVTLNDEINHIGNYLNIERERFGDRLQIEMTVADDIRNLPIIPLVLFPLIENCIKHGVSSTTEPSFIHVTIQRISNYLSIEVENSRDPMGTPPQSTGIGLQSLAKRLSASYGTGASLRTKATPQKFTVHVQIPLEASLAKPARKSVIGGKK